MFEGPSPKHCRVKSLFCTRGHCDLDLCPQCHLLVRTNILSKFEGPCPKHCKVIKLFSTQDHGDLDHDLCPQCHLLVRTNIPSKFEGSSPKHCQVIKLFSTKGPGDLDLCPRIIYWWGPTSLLRVLTISIAELYAFLVLKIMVTLAFDLKVTYSSGPSSLLVWQS